MNEKVNSILEKALDSGSKRKGHQGDYGFSCPFCNHPEHKKKLEVNLDPENEKYGWWKCWVCDNSGKSFFTLLKKVEAPKHLFEQLSKLVDGAPKSYEDGEEETEEEFSISLPQEYRPLWKKQNDIVSTHALNRLESRGLSKGDILKHRIGYCRSGKYKKRMIVPSFDRSGDLNYFVGRAIWSSQFPKYKNPSAPRNKIVPFESTINWDWPVVIVEGPFDAISVRRNAIPILGNKLPDRVKSKIFINEVPHVYLALDADMRETALDMGEEIMNEGVGVTIVDLPEGEDPDSIGFDGFWKLIKESEPLSKSKIIRSRLWA